MERFLPNLESGLPIQWHISGEVTDFARFFFCRDVHLIFCCENSETGGFDFLASSFFSFLGQGIQSRIVSSAAADATVVPSG